MKPTKKIISFALIFLVAAVVVAQNYDIELGIDGRSIFSFEGELNEPLKTDNFADVVNKYLEDCTPDEEGNCKVPIKVSTNQPIRLQDLKIYYTVEENQPNSLNVYWKLDGNGIDEMGIFNGSLYGDPVTEENCIVNSCLKFDGNNDFIGPPYMFASAPSTITFETWVKPQTISSDGYIFYNGKNAELGLVSNNNELSFRVKLNTHDWQSAKAKVIPNVWHHLAGVYDRENNFLKLYIDGELKDTVNLPNGHALYNPPPGHRSIVGAYDNDVSGFNPSMFFKGSLDEFKIHDEVLSPEIIKANYEKNKRDDARISNTPFAEWTFTGSEQEFDGVDDKISLDYTPPNNTFTVASRVKIFKDHEIDGESGSGGSGTRGQYYLFWPDWKQPGAGMGISLGKNGISVYEHSANYMPALAVYKGDVGPDWVDIVVVYNDRQPTIYLNGDAVRTGRKSTKNPVYAPSNVGGNVYGYFNGLVESVAVYDKALTAEEVKSLS